MSVLSVLGQGARIAGAGFEGYAQDQENKVKSALRQKEEERQQQQADILAAVQKRQGAVTAGRVKILRAQPEFSDPLKFSDEDLTGITSDESAFNNAAHLNPDPVKTATDIATATKGIPTYSDLHPHEPVDKTIVPVQQPDGSTVYMSRSQAIGKTPGKVGGVGGTGALAGPIAAKVGQFGEMLKKASDLMPATDALNVELGNSAAQDIATHGIGIAGHSIPGTTGIGSMMLNRSPSYAKYQAALSPFILAAAHALSGARINQDQISQIRASIEIKPGDSQEVRAQKHKNVIDLINSIGGALPSTAIAAQESQMDDSSLGLLTGYGYKSARGNTSGSTTAQPTHAQQLWDDAVKLHGQAKVLKEYGPRPNN